MSNYIVMRSLLSAHGRGPVSSRRGPAEHGYQIWSAGHGETAGKPVALTPAFERLEDAKRAALRFQNPIQIRRVRLTHHQRTR
jgi:hypothetical protein